MALLVPRSLKSLLLLHETAFVLLVVVTGAMGGMWAYFWQQSSEESLRINSLLLDAQQVRGDIYRQLKEVTRARLMEDPTALDQYWNHLYHIDRRFYQLQQHSSGNDETRALNAMRQAYEMMQTEMNKIFADPYQISEAVRMKIIDPAYEAWIVKDFEKSFGQFSSTMASLRQALELKLAYWTGLAPIIISVPILLATALLLYSHRSLQRGFVRPMGEIGNGAQKIAQGQLDHTIAEHGVEEVAQLAHLINDMAKELLSNRDALIESERQAALGALVPVVAHNIRNPLASIRAASQMVDHMDDPGDLKETKQAIIDTVDRLERWVSSLLSYLNPLQPKRQSSTLRSIAEGALKLLTSRIVDRKLDMIQQNWTAAAPLYVDVDLMEQAIYGLLNNAIEASPHGGKITLSMESSDKAVDLLIDDQGSGIPFTPQPTNLSPGPSTKRFGTGLGIPFAFKICHAHNGSLKFESSPHGGTRVRISLPSATCHQTENDE